MVSRTPNDKIDQSYGQTGKQNSKTGEKMYGGTEKPYSKIGNRMILQKP